MISNLVDQIVTLLQSGFAGVLPTPADHVVAGRQAEVAPESLPIIAVYADRFEIERSVPEPSSSEPRPQPVREELAVDGGAPAGPYDLARQPLAGTMRCVIVLDRGGPDERTSALQEAADYTIDHQAGTITFTTDIAAADLIQLSYSFVGVFTVREHAADLRVDVLAATDAELEMLASLTIAMIATNRDELIEQYNSTSPTEHSANEFTSTHSISGITLVEGQPTAPGALDLQLRYEVPGQLKLAKAIEGGFGLIEKIRSPGPGFEDDIDVGVE